MVKQSDHFLEVLSPYVGNIVEQSVMVESAEFHEISGTDAENSASVHRCHIESQR